MKEADAEVGVKDIIGFFIKIGDSERTRKEMGRFSASDKGTALDLINRSEAKREFKIDVARQFVNDLSPHIRRKSELMLGDLIPGWVADPASSILQVLRSAENRGGSGRNAAVSFLFGIVDADSLRITMTSLLGSQNRSHISEIIAIIEQYIDSSEDESEQVKIFNACLDMVLSDEIDMQVKHYATNLLSVFFKKVSSTALGSHLKAKFMEKQVEKGESVYRFICNGTSELTDNYLNDMLLPLPDGGKVYQLKILSYLAFLLDKSWDENEIGNHINSWSENRDEQVSRIRNKILKNIDELWDQTDDAEVRDRIMAVLFSGHRSKSELLTTVESRIEAGGLSQVAKEKIARLLNRFLKERLPEELRLKIAEMLLGLRIDCHRDKGIAALQGVVMERCIAGGGAQHLSTLQQLAATMTDQDELSQILLLLFMIDPAAPVGEQQRLALSRLRKVIEQKELAAEFRPVVKERLTSFYQQVETTENLKKGSAYLLSLLSQP